MEKIKVNMHIDDDQNIVKQMYREYLQCNEAIAELKKLGIPDDKIEDNITKIYDYVSDLNYCKKCPGLKKCNKDKPGLVTKIVYKWGVVDRLLSPCSKLNKKILIDHKFIHRDYPEEWLDATKKDLDEDKRQGSKPYISTYLDYLKKGINNWIYIKGGPRTGKTYLAAFICTNAVTDHDKGPVIFADCKTRIRELNDLSFTSKNEFAKELDMYINVPILVLDDFGNEMINDHTRDSIILPILNARSSKKLFTIITSQFSYDEISKLYTTNKNDASKIRADQIVRILKGSIKGITDLGEISRY